MAVVCMQVDYQGYRDYPVSMNPDSLEHGSPFSFASMGHFPLKKPVIICRSKVYGVFGASYEPQHLRKLQGN